jgi:glycosyltransferase involved in cell wall biosynthesis
MIPFFSVVIPVFNRSAVVLKTLLSVRDQTFSDFECIVVDDGSSDAVELERVVADLMDRRFRYVHQHNGGACSARNTGIDAAVGEYIAFLDSDDTFLPAKLEIAHRTISTTPSLDFMFSPVLVDRGVGKLWIKPPRGPASGERLDEYITCTEGWVQTSTMVVRRSLAKDVRFDTRMPSSQDTDFAIRCFATGASFHYHDKPLIIFNDVRGAARVSTQRNYVPLLAWANQGRGVILSERAYRGFVGWQCARVMSYSSKLKALGLFLPSAVRGTYNLSLACRIGAQIVLPKTAYQKYATLVVKKLGRPT